MEQPARRAPTFALTIKINLGIFVGVRFSKHLVDIFLGDWLSGETEDFAKLLPVNETISIPADRKSQRAEFASPRVRKENNKNDKKVMQSHQKEDSFNLSKR